MRNKKGYNAILEEAKLCNWPINYVNDLYDVDRSILLEETTQNGFSFGINNSVQFGWALRTNGTHLLRLDSYQGGRKSLSDYKKWVNEILYFFPSPKPRFYWFDGETLHFCPTVEEFYAYVSYLDQAKG